jgi:hypothetical protein
MATNDKKIQTGWEVPVEIRDSFRDFCVRVGAVAQEDCAGSLFLWQCVWVRSPRKIVLVPSSSGR